MKLQDNQTVLADLQAMADMLQQLAMNVEQDQPNLALQNVQSMVMHSTNLTRALWTHQQKASLTLPAAVIIGDKV